MYMPNVFPPILESLDVSRKLDIPDTNETKISGTATNFNIFTNIVPNGETQSEIYSPIPANTDTIPRIKPRIKPRIIFVWSAIFYFLLCKYKSTKTFAAIASTIGTARGTTQGSCLPFPLTVTDLFSLSTLSWSFIIVETGLKATLK